MLLTLLASGRAAIARQMVKLALTEPVVLLRSDETLRQSVSGNPCGAVLPPLLRIPRCPRPLFQQLPPEIPAPVSPQPARLGRGRIRAGRAGFFVLLFAIIETAIVFFASQVLETITQDSARLILTGQVQTGGNTQAHSRTSVCSQSR